MSIRKIRETKSWIKGGISVSGVQENTFILKFENAKFIKKMSDFLVEDKIIIDQQYIGLKIKEVFSDNKFKGFIKFCEGAKIQYLGELTNHLIMSYFYQYGVGAQKVKNILKKLNELEGAIIEKKLEPAQKYMGNEQIALVFGEQSYLQFVLYCMKNEKKIISDLNCDFLNEYSKQKGIGDKKFQKILDHLSIYSNELQQVKAPEEIFKGLELYLTEQGNRNWEILKLKAEDDATLQSVANQMSITRERVRQLINKEVKKIDIYLTQNQLIKSLKRCSENSVNISFDRLLKLVGKEYEFMLKIIADYSKIIYYRKAFDRFYFEEMTQQFERFEMKMNHFPEIFNYENKKEELNSFLLELQIEDFKDREIEKILNHFGYQKHGEAFSKVGLTLVKVAEYLFENHFKTPFKLDDEGVGIFKKYAKKYLEFEHEDGNIRNLDARFRDSNQIIAVNSFTYIWFDGKIDREIITEIDGYISEKLKNQIVVSANEVFEKFEARILPLGITSPYHLYYVIKYYLNESYQIGRGNTLEIYKDEASILTAEETLIKFLEQKGGMVKKEEICQGLKWESYRVEQRVGESRELIAWNGDSIRLLRDINIGFEEKKELEKMLQRLLKNHFTTRELILKELRKHDLLKKMFEKSDFENTNNLVAYCKKIANLKGHTSFLVFGESKYENIYDVINEKYRHHLSRRELKKFLSSLGYGEQMPGTVIKKLLEDKNYIEIGIDEICHKESFSIPQEVVKQVLKFIEEEMKEQEYLALSNFEKYAKKFPQIDYLWTAQIVKEIALANGYKQIERTHPDYRYEKIIIVKAESKLTDFEDLLAYIIKNEYRGDLEEQELYVYLERKGIVKKQDRLENKTFSQRIIKGNQIEINKQGTISLKTTEKYR